MTPTTFKVLVGIVFVAFGLFNMVLSSQWKRGNRKPNYVWGLSAGEAFWVGIGLVVFGLGRLSRFVVPAYVDDLLSIAGLIVIVVAVLSGWKKAKTAI